MAFRDFPKLEGAVQLLQRSLDRGRLAHGYLFTGMLLEELEKAALTLAKTLNCLQPSRSASGAAIDCCDACLNCRKIEHGNHADVYTIRPESKSRVIVLDQVRDLMQSIHLKPTEAEYKVAILAGADRLNIQSANAFLKTLEEPPAKSILVLLTTEPQRVLETILSRCLRLNFGTGGPRHWPDPVLQFLEGFSETAAVAQKSLLSRYRLMDVLLQKLGQARTTIEESLTARSPLQRYEDAEKDLREKWEDELAAAIEAEYRRQRADFLAGLEWWLRDVWVQTVPPDGGSSAAGPEHSANLLMFPKLTGSRQVAGRLSSRLAMENLKTIEQTQRRLATNVQEALALEVGLLKLHL
jgi:DNA polymerase-3 subunit delta'